ncbi:tyrosine-type recombinase/integrase [Candidatus Pacearchaeota archaeon]|nr:tyrosine-type recombinase/integrase [Candidatus Pacearchaeota archaeon]
MACLRSALTFAWRSERIQHIPPFPKRKAYHIVVPQIKWLPTQRQFNILELIPKDDQPVFFFLKYYMRRPAEACSIFESDFSENVFTICRTFSNDILTDTTKTGKVHTLPLIEDFKKHLDHARRIKARNGIISPYLFVNLRARNPGKHWTTGTLRTVWKLASKRAFEFVGLYEGLKHSSASQFINEKGLSLDQLMEITGHRQLDSIKAYAHTQMARKKELLETVVPISAKRPKGKT